MEIFDISKERFKRFLQCCRAAYFFYAVPSLDKNVDAALSPILPYGRTKLLKQAKVNIIDGFSVI
jgi:hypothetical protein